METKEEILSKLNQILPGKVPRLPSKGTPAYLYVQITIDSGRYWYRKDEVYKVHNKLYWGFAGGNPCFSPNLNKKGYPEYGISLKDCIVLSPGTLLKTPEPEYTLEEIADKLGHSFKLKIEAHGKTKN